MTMRNISVRLVQNININCLNLQKMKLQTISRISPILCRQTLASISHQADTRKIQPEYKKDIITSISKEDKNALFEKTPIQDFYSGKSVFITGGTGFLGKIVIQSLIKNCPDVSRIYMLIRRKKGKSSDDRFQDFLKNPIFNNVRERNSKLEEKIIAIPGDCSRDGLGLSDNHRELLKNEVSVVLHIAASVRFDDKLKSAVDIHLKGASNVIDLCHEISNLKSFLHCSTAFCNTFSPVIEERFYKPKIKYNELLALLNNNPDEKIDKLTPKLIDPWVNTYVFCKAIAEDMVREKCANLPTGIFKPALISASVNNPEPGWLDNNNALTGVLSSVYAGTLRTMILDPKKRVYIVPVDLTANAVIAAAWDISRQNERRGDNMCIYNYAELNDIKVTWGDCIKKAQDYTVKYPSKRTVWYPSVLFTKNQQFYNMYDFFLQKIPFSLLHSMARINGHESRFQIIRQRMRLICDVLRELCTLEWDFKQNNIKQIWKQLDSRDKELFPFMMQADWSLYLNDYMTGIRRFLFKDDLNTLEYNRKRIQRLYWIHQSLKLSFTALLFYILYGIFPTEIFEF